MRKRIAQFYRESRAAHPVQIELARGTYVPEFIIRAARRDNGAAEIAASDHSGRDPVAAQASSTAEAPSVSPFRIDRTAGVQAQIARTNASERKRSFKLLIFMALPIFLLVSGATTVVVSRDRAKNRIPQIWDAFQHSNVPVLICLGTHNLSDLSPEPSPDRETFTDLVLHKEMIPVDDVTAITRMASLLGHKGIPFRVVGAGLTSLTDLRRQPVILIGAVDNKWTLRLTQDLRYRIEFVRPAPNQEPIASITDAEQPGSTPWTIDFSVPMLAWKYDYAIVARVDDPTTGVPVLIDAGLGNDGSLAASELIASDALTKALAGEPHCREKSNFEAVVGTDIIDAKSGPPHILRLDCW
ncbi:MAG: hypothetical protein WBE72_07480 [Terracidiphilus sp.]